jgi:predicted dehydrogenase
MLDLARLFVGEVAAVSALLGIVTTERARLDGTVGVVDADDLAYLHLRYASGAFGLLRASQVAQGNGNRRRVELCGDRAALVLEIDDAVSRVLRADAHPGRAGEGFREVFALDAHLSAWSGNTLAWADAALDGRPTSPNFEDGLRVQEILDAAIRSHAERRWIDLA